MWWGLQGWMNDDDDDDVDDDDEDDDDDDESSWWKGRGARKWRFYQPKRPKYPFMAPRLCLKLVFIVWDSIYLLKHRIEYGVQNKSNISWWDTYHVISYISIASRRCQGLANPDLSREVVGGVDGGDHAVDGEEGGEVGRVRRDQDQREEPPDPTLASTRV